MLLTNVAPAALVIVSDTSILTSLSRDIKLVRSGEHTLVMTSDQPDYVSKLYAAGAWLVLPSLRNGCLDLRVVRLLANTGVARAPTVCPTCCANRLATCLQLA